MPWTGRSLGLIVLTGQGCSVGGISPWMFDMKLPAGEAFASDAGGGVAGALGAPVVGGGSLIGVP